ncbi:GbsR/MarR family transcriptional regulator [Paenibacillus tarimensis]|uniref:GbsR/MarR family transcriptional regulator n=1 Tax=Paenibacillus tarimensis TaxID=416012 RepID=UPI001F425A2C|nr:transcriptional regulator [Paenibacillus tarimensis]MCF2943070.1 transcriptional regulator [Paenibacillus tarimensis]
MTMTDIPSSEVKLERLKRSVIEAISVTMDLYGATPSVGELYGIMFFEDRPMTLEEMKDTMGMSKSSMSYAVRSLIESRMVHKLDEKLERKELYKAETDFYQAFQSFFTKKLQREVDVMRSAADKALPEVQAIILDASTSDELRKEALAVYHKLVHALEYYEWLQRFIHLLQQGKLFNDNLNKLNL